MKRKWKTRMVCLLCFLSVAVLWTGVAPAAQPVSSDTNDFPRSLKSYSDADERGIWAILKNRVQQEPFIF